MSGCGLAEILEVGSRETQHLARPIVAEKLRPERRPPKRWSMRNHEPGAQIRD
jgi:hypothetical protein